MSNQLRDYINTFYSKLNNIIMIVGRKDKKNIFKLKEGFIKFQVEFKKDSINCNLCKNPKLCSLKKCRHVYFLLINHFKLDIYQMSLLWKDGNWEKFYENHEIEDDYTKEECGVCLDEIEKNGKIRFDSIYQCLDCGNFSHHKCLRKVKEDHCLFCYKSSNPSFPL